MEIFEVKADYTKFNRDSLGLTGPEKPPVVLPRNEDTTVGSLMIEEAYRYYNALSNFRARRKRSRRYLRGDQWGDTVVVNGSTMTEEDYIRSQGRAPLKNNQIIQIKKNIMGQYRSNETKTIIVARQREDAFAEEMMSNAIQKVHEINKVRELDARNFEESVMSGIAICKSTYRYWRERNHDDIFTENVNPNRFFFNTDIDDIRGTDLRMCGQIIDSTLDDLKCAFAKSDSDAEWIESIYANKNIDSMPTGRGLSSDRNDSISFLTPLDPSKCRMFEIWKLQTEKVLKCHDQLSGKPISTRKPKAYIDSINKQRIAEAAMQGVPQDKVPVITYETAFEQIWWVYYLGPNGELLYKGETPYTHESNPYTLFVYPLIDGEVWGIIEDIIDQQRYINRLIILFDFILSASAKGVLLVPEDSIPDDMDLDDIAEEWTKFNGVIKVKMKPGAEMPKQVAVNSTNIGLQDMIGLQMKLLQEISGVNGAIQGQSAQSGTSGVLYAQQVQNSNTNLKDLFESYQNLYQQTRDMKLLRLIGQYYEKRSIISSNMSNKFDETKFFDPDRVRDIDFDLVISQSNDTPVYRQLIEDNLFKLVEMQAISVETYLENSSIPFADKLLESVQNQKEAIMSGQQSPEVDQSVANQMMNGVNPKAMNIANQILGQRPQPQHNAA